MTLNNGNRPEPEIQVLYLNEDQKNNISRPYHKEHNSQSSKLKTKTASEEALDIEEFTSENPSLSKRTSQTVTPSFNYYLSLTSQSSSTAAPEFGKFQHTFRSQDFGLLPEDVLEQNLNDFLHTLWGKSHLDPDISGPLSLQSSKPSACTNRNHYVCIKFIEENKKLQVDLRNLYARYQLLQAEHGTCGVNLKNMKIEVTRISHVAVDFERKNVQLQNELNEIHHKERNYLQQIEDFQQKFQASKKVEEEAVQEIHRLKDQLKIIEEQCQESKTRCEEFRRDNEILKQQKNKLEDFNRQQKTRADVLEDRGKSLQEAITRLTAAALGLEHQLKKQRIQLETKFQQQLNQEIADKQKQLHTEFKSKEEILQQEASNRERQIARHAVKHLQMMNNKNEQEVAILLEKHSKELELYRMQLERASRRIENLESCLNNYKLKSTESGCNEMKKVVSAKNSQEGVKINSRPTTLKSKSDTTVRNQHRTDDSKVDLVQKYVEFLLNETLVDFASLNELIGLASAPSKTTSKTTLEVKKSTSSAKMKLNKKPPWRG